MVLWRCAKFNVIPRFRLERIEDCISSVVNNGIKLLNFAEESKGIGGNLIEDDKQTTCEDHDNSDISVSYGCDYISENDSEISKRTDKISSDGNTNISGVFDDAKPIIIEDSDDLCEKSSESTYDGNVIVPRKQITNASPHNSLTIKLKPNEINRDNDEIESDISDSGEESGKLKVNQEFCWPKSKRNQQKRTRGRPRKNHVNSDSNKLTRSGEPKESGEQNSDELEQPVEIRKPKAKVKKRKREVWISADSGKICTIFNYLLYNY